MAHSSMENLPKLISWADKVMANDAYRPALQMFRDISKDPTNNWNQLIQQSIPKYAEKILDQLHGQCRHSWQCCH